MSNPYDGVYGNDASRRPDDFSPDEAIALHALTSSAASANAYLTATLQATTPEVRQLLYDYTTQNILANETLTDLSVKKNWLTPYQSAEQQLETSINQSQYIIQSMKQ